jgi:CelD/BcsL family acetyltransferase involved in cellulose biosynthesis
LHFISSGLAEFEETCAEYLDFLYAPGEGVACVKALAAALKEATFGSDFLELTDVSATSPLLALVEPSPGSRAAFSAYPDGVCFAADLSAGFEAYLGSLSGETRKEARKALREAERAKVKFEIASDPETAGMFFDQLVTLHRRRWAATGKAGTFAPRHARFHRALARTLTPTSGVILARCSVEGIPVAVMNTHRVGGEVHIYQQGVPHEGGPLRSPGTVATLLLMAHLAERGVTTVDQLKGSNSFKQRFFKEQRPLVRLRRDLRTVRSALGRAGTLVWQAARAIRNAGRTALAPRRTGLPMTGQQTSRAQGGADD